ncbi:MAG: DNA adenine methylase [Clostridiaceae bacterium]|nr:DNA adenine methylase [Clostridiaceae bacterium]
MLDYNHNTLLKPALKWIGGKTQLLSTIVPLLPDKYNTYCEPFVGGGALLFHIQPHTAIINDINTEIITAYNVIKYDVENLIVELKTFKNESDFYYWVRSWDRDTDAYNNISNIKKAARILYLNKTCFNGLYRVNNQGKYNVPFGKYKNPNIVNEVVLRHISEYFNKCDITILNADYTKVLESLPRDSFVYLDPPYDPLTKTANFTKYSSNGFSQDDQIELKEICDELTSGGVKFMLSNSSTEFIKNLYSDGGKYNIIEVDAARKVNCVASKRGKVSEVIVRNYK